ncbi:MAG TPA: PUA domain-containing protein [Candidatus Krumholzibacteriaceae bacterium]|nr:PUA domain-containing protein [Candidatus Krumholzibacteriaceae bacterium]
MNKDIVRLRAVADYQFGRGAGAALFPDDARIEYSKNTGKPRHIWAGEELVANYRPNDALFTVTIAGARRLVAALEGFKYSVRVMDDVVEFVEQGKNVFAKHVRDAGESIRPGDEVVVVDGGGEVVAVGKSKMNREDMLSFKTGTAVRVRRGRKKDR